jgi:hypothetical protein
MTNDSSPGVLLVLVMFFVGLLIWFLIAYVAAALAPSDRSWTFFWLTLPLFGPLGIVLAVVASPRDPAYFAPSVAAGYTCPQCRAENDPPHSSGRSKTTGDKLRDALVAKWETQKEAEASADQAEARAKAARARADELRQQVRKSEGR